MLAADRRAIGRQTVMLSEASRLVSPGDSLADRRFLAAPERSIICIVGASHLALGLAQNDGLAAVRTVLGR